MVANVVPCPICGQMFSKAGLPNHLRTHNQAVSNGSALKSRSWWQGFAEGYKMGLDAARESEKEQSARRDESRYNGA